MAMQQAWAPLPEPGLPLNEHLGDEWDVGQVYRRLVI